MEIRLIVTLCAAAVGVGCSSSSGNGGSPPAALRPGVEDSSQVYMGTPDANESAFWAAVRDGDDTGRAGAVSQLMADVANDPTNGYSEFLVGASMFMPSNDVLRALAAGSPPTAFRPDPAAAQYLGESLSHLTDPFYLGFGGGLLGALELAGGNAQAGQATFATAVGNNHAATGLISVIDDLQAKNLPGALADVYKLIEYCNGGPVDHAGADVDAYVAKQNAATLVQRECYSGYFAMHGSEGLLLITGDLQALNGNPQAASAYYKGLQNDANYSTWALQPLVARRLSGAQPADPALLPVITASCPTCHTNTLP